MLDSINRSVTEAFEPVYRLTELALSQAERFTNFQVDAAKAYAEFGIEQARGALSVTDTVAFHDYLTKQQDTATTLARKVSDDAQTVMGFGKEFLDGAGDVARDSIQRTPNPMASITGKRAA